MALEGLEWPCRGAASAAVRASPLACLAMGSAVGVWAGWGRACSLAPAAPLQRLLAAPLQGLLAVRPSRASTALQEDRRYLWRTKRPFLSGKGPLLLSKRW
jgi:hypothetical protein